MSDRVWVRNAAGTAVREVAASAVPIMAPAGWRPLDDAELAEHERRQADEKAARVEAFTAVSARRAAPSNVSPPRTDLSRSVDAEKAGKDGAEAPRRSGAKRRQDTTPENEES